MSDLRKMTIQGWHDSWQQWAEDTIDGWTAVPPALSDPDNEANEQQLQLMYSCACNPDVMCTRSCMKQDAPARHPNSQRFHDILVMLGDLHDKKQKDYGRGDDPFANVRGSEEWGMPAWVGAMVRANDKIRRLQQYARTGTLANEGVEDAFLDLAVYAVIAMVLWEQDQ